MQPSDVIAVLRALGRAELSEEEAVASLSQMGSDQASQKSAGSLALLEGARVDLERARRQGIAEVIFGEGKTAAQIAQIAAALREAGQSVLATRVDAEKAKEVQALDAELSFDATASALFQRVGERAARFSAPVGIVAAGTSDLKVVREAQLTLELNGEVTQIFVDVGVAGLHRLLRVLPEIEACSALICVAGMEGALASVLGGLTRKPLVCVPTSVGYGAALGGFSALSGMLTSCSSGATVVNIDNGFGAAMAILRIGEMLEQMRQ